MYDQKTFDGACQSEWFMPEEYKSIDLYTYISDRCKTDKELVRATEELEEFEKRRLI